MTTTISPPTSGGDPSRIRTGSTSRAAASAPAAPPNGAGITRRQGFIASAFLGGSALLASCSERVRDLASRAESGGLSAAEQYELAQAQNILYTVCLQCNTGCGIKAKILDGVVAKIDGNPLTPWTMTPHLPYTTKIQDVAAIDGAICPKGQAGIQSTYDPYRLVKVLKRAGPRGSNQWQTISFEAALTEIVEGGTLFKNVPGEENRRVTGLKELYVVKDAATMKALADDAAAVASKKMTLEEFKTKQAAHLDKLIDPNHPDMGPKNNQFVVNWGRLKAGRSDFINRFTRDSFGSTNTHGHTTVCQGSLYFTGKAMSEQYTDGKWTGGKKFYWQADTGNSEFILFVGASPLEGNYGPPVRAPKIMDGISSGKMKIAVVDPRLSKTAAKAWKWLPNKPGTEGALALGLIRWVIDNQRYDARYLANANKAAATADKEPTWNNGTWLVKLGNDGTPGAFLRASDIGLPVETRRDSAGKDYTFDPFIVARGDELIPLDPNDTRTPVEGDLFVERTVDGATGPIGVKSGLQLLADESRKNSIDKWADISGVKAQDVVDLAREFTSHGKKAVADIHRGVSQHTNGFYNVFAWYSLNLLIGNYDWKGGLSQPSTWDQAGSRAGKPFDTTKWHSSRLSPFGISIIRHDTPYENTTIFNGYPAKRPWYTLASDVYQEILPSIGDQYPYPVKTLLLYMGSPVYSLPSGDQNIPILADVNKLPLFIASDIVVGETSMYADYIFPDLTYLERWEFQGTHPNIPHKVQPVRQPVIAPMTETVKVFGVDQPISLESLLLGLAEKLGLPGFGKDGLGPGRDLVRAEDLYLPMVANIAFGDAANGSETVPAADDAETKLFLDSRRHLPKTVFDAAYWEKLVGPDWWRKVVYVLNRGGRFANYEDGYDGALLKNKYGVQINLYMEKTAKTINAMTGKPLPGIATYIPPSLDALGRPVADDASYDLNLITHREIYHTKSRTSGNYWLQALWPENFIMLSNRDAQRLGFRDGETARVVSASNPTGVWDLKNGIKVPMAGKIKVIEGIRPGVISFSLGHGHWAYGAMDTKVDGKTVKGEARRRTGFHGNAAMRVDPHLKNTTLADLVGGSAVFYDTRVKLVRESQAGKV
jgi:tetrathionate reductase subunit A